MKATLSPMHLAVVIIGMLAGCRSPIGSSGDLGVSRIEQLSYNNYAISQLADLEMPYTRGIIINTPLLRSDSTDSDGILMFNFNGNKHYHPVQLAQRILLFVRSFNSNGDSVFITEADKYIEKLFEIGDLYEDAVFFPYSFDILPHGGTGDYNREVLRSPWYSGMAQGQVLSALVRLYRTTGDSKYLDYAASVFNSFLILKSDGSPWIVYVDQKMNYWIEEYPLSEPTNVLNGFIFAIYGLYDYYLLDPEDKNRLILLAAAITTIEANINRYRRPGRSSLYCLKHRHYDDEYHVIHSEQLGYLARISGSVYLEWMWTQFVQDAEGQ